MITKYQEAIKKREEARVQKELSPIQVVFIKRLTIYIKISSNNHYIMGHGCPFKKSTAKMRWKWKKKRTRRLQRKRRKMRARAK